MTIATPEYARLADDAYKDRSQYAGTDKIVTIGGIEYKILAVANDPNSDYQGTAYQRKDTGEVVIAHRGTESLTDGVVDAGMIATNLNAQAAAAQAFTERAMQVARATEDKYGHPVAITTTGHSLGGCLAQVTAYHNGLHGETFNPYFGAASLDMGIPEGGSQVINHARATDIASATGKHFGEMHLYMPTEDIDLVRKGRYLDDNPNNNNPLLTATIDAHKMGNFPDILTPENEARALAYAKPIAEYRQDVLRDRIDLHTVWNHQSLPLIPDPPEVTNAKIRLTTQVGDLALTSAGEKIGQAYDAARDAVVEGARTVEKKAEQAYTATRDAVVEGAQTIEKKAEQAYTATRDAVVEGAQTVERKAEQAYTATRDAVVQGAQTVERKAEQAYTATRDAVAQGAQTVERKAEQAYTATRDAVAQGAQAIEKKAEQVGRAVNEGATRTWNTLTHPGSWFGRDKPAQTDKPSDNPSPAAHEQGQPAQDKVKALTGNPLVDKLLASAHDPVALRQAAAAIANSPRGEAIRAEARALNAEREQRLMPDNHRDRPLLNAIAAHLPEGTSLDTAANVLLHAKQNGINKPEQIDKVLVKDGRVFVEGKTPGFECVTNLYPAPALEQTMKQVDALNQHNDQQQQERQQRQAQGQGMGLS